jgi:hypothetical protein
MFSKLGHSFDIFRALVVNFLHEIELGVFKSIFTHSIHILFAYGNNTVQVLNER